MKYAKIVFLTICVLLIGNICFAQETYRSMDGKENFIFIGSVDGSNIKLIGEDGFIVWKSTNDLNQTGILSPEEFLDAIMVNSLAFFADGDEPFWSAILTKDSITLSANETEVYPIKTVVNKYDIDGSFSLMFQSDDHGVYGLIREYTYFPADNTMCDLCLNDEKSLFEIFINYNGILYKGCSTIAPLRETETH